MGGSRVDGAGAEAAAAHARLIEDNLVLTCAAERLYSDGGFAGDAALLDRLRGRVSRQTQVLGEAVYLRVREIGKRSVSLVLNDAEMTLKF